MARLQAGIEPGAPNEAAITANLHRATRVPTRKDIAQRYAGVPAHAPNKKGPVKCPGDLTIGTIAGGDRTRRA